MTEEINWPKLFGELLADHELRIAETVARAAAVPPELAEQIASAVRMLHESPPVEQRSEAPRPPPKVTRIERDADGNFVPVYDDQPV